MCTTKVIRIDLEHTTAIVELILPFYLCLEEDGAAIIMPYCSIQ